MAASATNAPAIAAQRTSALRSAVIRDYWALTKPEVNFLIVIATAAGFYLGSPEHLDTASLMALLHTLIGMLLTASGAATLNQYIERRFDAQMRRTARRPLAAGRLSGTAALRFGLALSFAGVIYLVVTTNALASLLALLTLTSYLGLYTPLKRKTPVCTFIGAWSGAMPPLIGWAAAAGRLSGEAWVVCGVLFLWQFPHFMAIAWIYRDDYDRAGYLVLPPGSRRSGFVAWQSVLPAAALIPMSLAPTFLGNAGLAYLTGAFLLSAGFLCYAAQLVLRRSNSSARQLLFASIIYLPALLVLMMATKS